MQNCRQWSKFAVEYFTDRSQTASPCHFPQYPACCSNCRRAFARATDCPDPTTIAGLYPGAGTIDSLSPQSAGSPVCPHDAGDTDRQTVLRARYRCRCRHPHLPGSAWPQHIAVAADGAVPIAVHSSRECRTAGLAAFRHDLRRQITVHRRIRQVRHRPYPAVRHRGYLHRLRWP